MTVTKPQRLQANTEHVLSDSSEAGKAAKVTGCTIPQEVKVQDALPWVTYNPLKKKHFIIPKTALRPSLQGPGLSSLL